MAASRSFSSGSNNVSYSCSLDTTTDNITVAVWIKIPSGWNSGTDAFVTMGGTQVFFAHSTNKFRVQLGTTITSSITVSSLAGDGLWHHIVGTNGHTGDNTSCNLYIDGVLEAENSDSTVDRSGNVVIQNPDTTGGLLISDLHVYNRQLSKDEINEIMYNPNSIPGAYIYSPIWGSSPEQDLSGNGRDGTVTGTATSTDGPPISFPQMIG